MNDDPLNTLLKNMNPPPIDESAKKRAIHLAMTEFEQQHTQHETNTSGDSDEREKKAQQNQSQGLWPALRPISHFYQTVRNTLMMTFNNKRLYSGIATISIAVVGVLIFQQSNQTPYETIPSSLEEQLGSPQDLATPRSTQEKSSVHDSNTTIIADANRGATAPVAAKKLESHSIARRETPTSHRLIGQTSNSLSTSSATSKIVHKPQRSPSEPPHQYKRDIGRDKFESVENNPIKLTAQEPVSTFSIDVDTASYSFVRRQLNHGVLPQKAAVRAEEMINYFDYQYPLPSSTDQPFKPSIMVHPSPWNTGKQLVHIGIKGYDITPSEQPRSHLILLLDVSGSMSSPDKLPLVKQSMSVLLNRLHPEDTIGIVVYAGAAGMVLEPTAVKEKQTILNALNRLNAGGSTAGGQGIKLAYQLAENHFDKDAVNRVILATDGDFNVGITNREELKGFIERKRKKGIFLSVLGFGTGNYNDHLMQTLAQNGNGVAAYIDSLHEAQKILVHQATSTLFPIAKDVKIQVEFNPNTVAEYRLVGYETRQLKREDFNNDAVDAGDIGAAHSVTAIYEITPKGSPAPHSSDPLRYTDNTAEKSTLKPSTDSNTIHNQEYGFLKIRYKQPQGSTSQLIEKAITIDGHNNDKLFSEVQFATAVASFAQKLKGGKYLNNFPYEKIIALAQANKGDDPYGYRTEFIQLVRKAITAEGLN